MIRFCIWKPHSYGKKINHHFKTKQYLKIPLTKKLPELQIKSILKISKWSQVVREEMMRPLNEKKVNFCDDYFTMENKLVFSEYFLVGKFKAQKYSLTVLYEILIVSQICKRYNKVSYLFCCLYSITYIFIA